MICSYSAHISVYLFSVLHTQSPGWQQQRRAQPTKPVYVCEQKKSTLHKLNLPCGFDAPWGGARETLMPSFFAWLTLFFLLHARDSNASRCTCIKAVIKIWWNVWQKGLNELKRSVRRQRRWRRRAHNLSHRF